jgi:predicted PurR-regulated permease PerM
VLFAVTLCLGVYFISAAYPQLQTWLDIHLPEVWQRRRLAAAGSMRFTLGRYVRAQGILMVITFLELLLAFLLLRIEGALLLAAVTAFLDALPILGAGAVLLPWAAVCFLGGDAAAGAGCSSPGASSLWPGTASRPSCWETSWGCRLW